MKKHCGLTLIELMVTLAVMAIIATMAVPGMNNYMKINRLRGATSQFYADVQFARSESIKRKADISVSITSDGGNSWCYGIDQNTGCDCSITDTTDANACTLSISGTNVLKVRTSQEYPDINLISHNGTNLTYTTFHSIRGTASSANAAIFQSNDSFETHVDVSILGKVSACTPAGSSSVSGYSIC